MSPWTQIQPSIRKRIISCEACQKVSWRTFFTFASREAVQQCGKIFQKDDVMISDDRFKQLMFVMWHNVA